MSNLISGNSIPDESCGSCIYKLSNGNYCRRFPPVVNTEGRSGDFPIVYSSWWWGEYKRRITER